MPFSLPDKGEGQSDVQSIFFQEYLDVLVAAMRGVDHVVSGLAVTAQGSPNMTVAVAKGAVISNGTLFAVAANASVTITTANATNPRIDLVVIDSSGAIAVRAGTAAAAPKPPARTANDVVLAAVWVPANDTTISADQITDLRIDRGAGTAGGGAPILLKKSTTQVVFNNSSAQNTLATVTLPSGLFTTGQIVRLRAGGTILANNTTPTLRLVITYGGTTMFSDISGATTNDTDRLTWMVDLNLIAVSNSSQRLVGVAEIHILGAKTAPTTGTGDVWSTASHSNSFTGTASVDSDAGNRAFNVDWTMSVANASNEVTCDFMTAELL